MSSLSVKAYGVVVQDFCPLARNITRFSNGFRLNIPSCRIAAGQRAFYYRGVKIWNNLSKDLKQITDTKVFKKRLIN